MPNVQILKLYLIKKNGIYIKRQQYNEKMKYCKKCNAKNVEEAIFCRKCGEKLSRKKYLKILLLMIPFLIGGIVCLLCGKHPFFQNDEDAQNAEVLPVLETDTICSDSTTFVDSTTVIQDTQDTQEEENEQKSFYKYNWAGTYSASSYIGRTYYGGLAIIYGIDINLKNDGENYSGTIDIDGYQFFTKYTIIANSPMKNHLIIYADSHRDGFEKFDNGEALCELIYSEDGILTADWFGAMEGFVNEETKISD